MTASDDRRSRSARCVGIAAIIFVLALAGCDDQKVRMQRLAAAAQANRAAGSSMIAQAYAKDTDTIDLLMTMASDKMARGEDATALAGAVLDATRLLGKQLPQGDEFFIFWTRIGRLAFESGLFAYQKGRLAEANDLILAGSPRWQTEQYWLRYTDHDALASIILFQSGEQQRAVQRLRERTLLDGDAEAAYEKLTGGR